MHEDFAALWSAVTPTAQAPAPLIWMHERNRVFSQPALDKTHPGGVTGAIMRPVFRCFQQPPLVEDGNARSSNGQTGCHALGVPLTLSTRRSNALPTFLWAAGPLRACAFIIDLKSVGTWSRQRRQQKRRMWACDRMARRSTYFHDKSTMTQRSDTRFAHIPTPALPFCSHIVFGVRFSINVLMHAMHSAAPAVYHMHAQHCMTPYHTHSTQPRVVLLCLLVASSLHSLHIWKGTLLHASSPIRAWPLLERICLHSNLFFFDFFSFSLTFFFSHIWRDGVFLLFRIMQISE